jgi:hypothetical protein
MSLEPSSGAFNRWNLHVSIVCVCGPQYWSSGSRVQNRSLIAHFLQTSILVVGSTEVKSPVKMRVGNIASSNPSRSSGMAKVTRMHCRTAISGPGHDQRSRSVPEHLPASATRRILHSVRYDVDRQARGLVVDAGLVEVSQPIDKVQRVSIDGLHEDHRGMSLLLINPSDEGDQDPIVWTQAAG